MYVFEPRAADAKSRAGPRPVERDEPRPRRAPPPGPGAWRPGPGPRGATLARPLYMMPRAYPRLERADPR